MANDNIQLSEESYEKLEQALGRTRAELEAIPAVKLARALAKLEIESRPQARIDQQQVALRGRAGRVPDSCHEHAFHQIGEMHEACQTGHIHKTAGMPVGLPNLVASSGLAPSAGLNPDNTGWTPLGPGNIGGRTRAIVIDPTDTSRIFTATAGGGVWRSPNAGLSWVPTDDLMGNLATCSLAMDPGDPNTLYAGTGEGFGNVDAIRGDGIFVTNDSGVTWTSLTATQSNPDFHFVNALVFTADGQTLLAGTTTGIFRSIDVGQTWTQELAEEIGNLECHPTDANRAIAGRRRGGRAYVTIDGGASWQEAGRPTSNGRRVQVCYATADPTVTYASVEAPTNTDARASQLWRSTDGGQTYTSQNGNPGRLLGGQGWYDNAIWAGDPTNSDLLIVGGVDLWRSTDGGDTFLRISDWADDQSAHADHHVILSDPGYDGVNNRRVWFGNDGGVYRTDDATTVTAVNGWTGLNNGYAVTQFYYADGHVGTSTILGGAQDNGTLRYTPAQGENAWNESFGGDGGDVASDPSDPQIWYGEYVNMEIFRNTNGGSSGSFVNDTIVGRFWNNAIGDWGWKPAPFGIQEVRNGQAQFIAPFELDSSNPNRILGGAMSLWETIDARTANTDAAGPSWTAIKAPIGTSRWTHSITAIAIAPRDSAITYVGHANGDVYRSNNATGNATWTQIDTNGINANRSCLALTVDPDDSDIVYAGFSGYEADNLWHSADGGQSWTDISGSLPDVPIRDVSLHPQRSAWVYLGTQVGVFASEDSGATWSPTNEGPANVACNDLLWMGCKLVCVSHGRGMFEIDLTIANALPKPLLAFDGTEDYVTSAGDFTRYRLAVTNRAAYPDSLFRPSPDLPPCGSNSNAARTWIDVYDANTDQRIQGFCALSNADDLGGLWFGLPRGDAPPSQVYVVLRDRRCTAAYTSDPIAVTGIQTGSVPAIQNPVPGSTLTDDVVTFEWSPGGASVSQWWLYIGSSLGGRQHYNSGSLGTLLFETVTGLPTNGNTIFARLWHREAGVWKFTDAQYTAMVAETPEITSPAPGTTLSREVTFEWSAQGATVSQWWLYVGSTPGGRDLYDSGSLGTSLLETVSGLPDDGSVVHARLWYRIGGAWRFVDTQYQALTAGIPAITSPPPDSTLTGQSVTFDWVSNGAHVALYWIYVGSTVGTHNLFDSGPLGTSLSTVVTGLPGNGDDVFLRLWYRSSGVWLFNDHRFTSN